MLRVRLLRSGLWNGSRLSSSWMETAQVGTLSRGSDEPFYQDSRFWLMHMQTPTLWWHMVILNCLTQFLFRYKFLFHCCCP
ncbi:hypothetical protein L3X38_020578 [Prunus dulcis]|uniref:Uncharacterized protein n=1 Tax=Prunus dulcis TaxID=3755 RepID=A0AAD4ZD27_PRUDU|nr:hypothetical protein L3X38_020578 [Prunus dulcis]